MPEAKSHYWATAIAKVSLPIPQDVKRGNLTDYLTLSLQEKFLSLSSKHAGRRGPRAQWPLQSPPKIQSLLLSSPSSLIHLPVPLPEAAHPGVALSPEERTRKIKSHIEAHTKFLNYFIRMRETLALHINEDMPIHLRTEGFHPFPRCVLETRIPKTPSFPLSYHFP